MAGFNSLLYSTLCIHFFLLSYDMLQHAEAAGSHLLKTVDSVDGDCGSGMQALQNAIDYIDSSLEVRYVVEECKALWGSCDRATILLCIHNSWKCILSSHQ